MEQWREAGKRLKALLNVDTLPTAVTLLPDAAAIPDGIRRPNRDLKVRVAPCQGTAMARRYGWRVAITREDSACAIANHTYGWERLADERGAIEFLKRMSYSCDDTAAREVVARFRTLDMGDNMAVVYEPLERTVLEPDVVMIYANPAQIMRVLHGATYHRGLPVESSFSGRAASCTEGVIAAYLDGTPIVVVPGNGDRVWATCQDHEMLMVLPGALLAEIVEGLENTHAKGVRYPIPSYLRYTPTVGMSLPLADIFKTGD